MSTWQIVFYATRTGRRPVAEYLDTLTGREAAAMRKELRLLTDFGLDLGLPHARPLGRKLWELRIRAERQHRVLYFAASEQRLILLHAFTKKTQETPRGELDTALARMVDYQAREEL